jgi:hypothetical protein
MTDVQIVRVIAQDLPQYSRDSHELSEDEMSFQTEQHPVVTGSVIITGQETLPAFTVNTDAGVVTFASQPSAQTLTVTYMWCLLSDESIQTLIDLNTGNEDEYLKLAAAAVLDSIASNQSLLLKKIKVLDVQVDGPAVAADLRKHAAELRDQVFKAEQSGDHFDITEQINNNWAWWEQIGKDIERGGL